VEKNHNITYTFTENIYDSIVVEKDNIIINGNSHTLQGIGTGNGFSLLDRSNVTIKNVRIIQFYIGISLVHSTNNTITENTVSSNNHGIHLYQSTNSTVGKNTVTSNQGGIIVYQGSNSTKVENNTVSFNDFGIDLGMANRCTITSNNITNNTFGISVSHSSNNNIYHNNFIDNSHQVYSIDESLNTWDDDYPSGGNYWSDYAGLDMKNGSNQNQLGSDGIGDTPYIINANNQDRYPRMSYVGILDIIAPTISIISPLNGSEVKSSTLTVTWAGSDAISGISFYEIRLDGGSWISVGTNTTHIFIGLGDGTHAVEVKATDRVRLSKQSLVSFVVNTSPLFGPSYIEEVAITATIIIVALGTAMYLLKIRKKS